MSQHVKAKVFVKGPPFKQMTEATFQGTQRYQIVNKLDDADIVVWTGGADIYPGLYGEKPIPGTGYGGRDKSDVEAVEAAFKNKQFMVGICRGAQLLNCVPNGGKLWQDVDGHGGLHKAFDCVSGEWLVGGINSVHHQMCRLTPEAEVVCWTQEATYKRAEKEHWIRKYLPKDMPVLEKDKDIEAAWYPKTRSFLFQAHPEFGHPPTTRYFFRLLDRYYWNDQSVDTATGE